MAKQNYNNITEERMMFIDDLEFNDEYPIDYTDINFESTDAAKIIEISSSKEDEGGMFVDSSLQLNDSSLSQSTDVRVVEESSFESSGGSFYNEEFSDMNESDSDYETEEDWDDTNSNDESDDEMYFQDMEEMYGNGGYSLDEEYSLEDEEEISDNDIEEENNIEIEREESEEVIVLETRNINQTYPKITYELVTMILIRMYMAYNLSMYDYISLSEFSSYPYSNIKIADRIRDFNAVELEFLKSKISIILMNDIRDIPSVRALVNLISVDKIDNIDRMSFSRTKFASTQFKDMINVTEKSCGICYGDFKPVHKCTSLHCLHTFHTKCIKKWVSVTWCCPMCRSKDIG